MKGLPPVGPANPERHFTKGTCRKCARPIKWLSDKGKWFPQEEAGGPHNCPHQRFFCKYCGARIIWKQGSGELPRILPFSPITLKKHECKEWRAAKDPPDLASLPKDALIDGLSAILFQKPGRKS